MRVMLATIALNEEEWLPKLIQQHRNWPGLCGWVFVEGADQCYADTNPGMVTKHGMSTDRTTEILHNLCTANMPGGNDFFHIRHGFASIGCNRDQNKCVLRNMYLDQVDKLQPNFIVVLDADEFYTRDDQLKINELCEEHFRPGATATAIMLKQRHIWRPSSVCLRCEGMKVMREVELGNGYYRAEPFFPNTNPIEGRVVGHWPCAACKGSGTMSSELFSQEVVGGYWQVPHTRVWKYIPGMRHIRNHNWPEADGEYLTKVMLRIDLMKGDYPQCIHFGYASSPRNRSAKHSYYVARGEGQEPGRIGKRRRMYLDCRSAWENWRPGSVLPHGAEVIEYKGPIPEVFR